MSLKEDFNNLSNSVKMMEDQMKMLDSLINTTIESIYGLDIKVREKLEELHFDKILSMTDEEVEQFLIDTSKQILVVDGTTPGIPKLKDMEYTPSRANVEALEEHFKTASDEWKDKPFYDYCRHVLKSIKDSLMERKQLEEEKNKLIEDMHKIEDDYFSYVNTKEYKDKRAQKIQEMLKASEDEPDELKRNKIRRDLETMQNAESLRFLVERIEEKGKREVDNIVDSYFNQQRSTLIMKKFAARIPKLGFNKDIYKFFFNIEENFLPEEFHVFNNIFLFNVMRQISYMDVDSRSDNLYASTIIVRLYNLVYHKFTDQALEDEFIAFIQEFDKNFESWRERFEKDNLTHPKHPARIEKNAEAEKKRRMMTISELKHHGIEPDTSKTTEELVQQLRDIVDEKENSKKKELEEWSEKNDTEDSSVSSNQDDELVDTQAESEGSTQKATSGYAEITPVEEPVEVPVVVEEMPEEPGEAVQVNNDMPPVVGRGTTIGPVISKVAYMDRFGYYYMQEGDGSYTYYTNEDKVYESGFSEEDILKLLNTGSLEKIIKTFTNPNH